MNRTRYTLFLLWSLLMVTGLGLSSCGSGSSIPETAAESPETGILQLSLAQFTEAGMQWGKPEPHLFSTAITCNGKFDVPPENMASVSPYFGGYVKMISLLPGQSVKKGQLLFTLENPAFVTIQEKYLEAKGKLVFLEDDYKRQKQLAEENISSQKKYLQAESDYRVTLARYESLRKQLELMNLNPDQVTPQNLRTTLPIYAPIDGFVTHVRATIGSYLEPHAVVVSLMKADHLHLELNLLEKDLPAIKVGQVIEFHLPDRPSETFAGNVHLINKSLNPESRMIQVHAHLAPEVDATQFVPGMYTEAKILTSADTLLALPKEAVTLSEEGAFVWVSEGASGSGEILLKQQEIQTGKSEGDWIEITGGLEGQAEVLVSGGYQLGE